MRKIAIVVALLMLGIRADVAWAEDEISEVCKPGPVKDTYICSEVINGVLPTIVTPVARPAGNVAPIGPVKKYVPYNRLGTGPDGQPCATTGYVEEGVAPSDERSLVDPNPLESKGPNYRDVLEDYPPCPAQPQAPGVVAPVETRSMVAARFWTSRVLPKPQPSIAPGRAITGKLAYLETKGELTHTYRENTVFGPLTVVATGSYSVDWGDGTTTGPHGFEGKAWPNGQITHDYLNVGSYNVVVTEKWTATWSLDGESGILRTLQTTGTITNFPVEQIQAVIGR